VFGVKQMKWVSKEIDTYLKAKEYVDTAVIPLYSISFGDEMKQSAAMAEFITLLTSHLERQFTGRIVLFPPFTYLKNNSNEEVINDLKKWEANIEESEFKHIFYITTESEWRLYEQKFTGSIIWLPALPFESMDDSQKVLMVDSQVKQLLNLFTQKWHENG
jgi:hypothetical protein